MAGGARAWIVRALLPAALVLAGCSTTPWVRGSIDQGRPKLERKLPQDVAFFVTKTEKRVGNAFRKALEARGFALAEKEETCDIVLKATVESWEFNDVGFGGRGGNRDDMELSVLLVDRRRHRVLSRAKISIRSDFRIISKYVEGL